MVARSTLPASTLTEITEAVGRFGAEVGPKLRNGSGGAEDQLRGPFERLLDDLGRILGIDVLTVGEVSLAALGIRPDYSVDVAGAHIGYVELKAPGKGVPTTWTPTSREQKQWDKLRLLPNVLYSDGQQYAVYRSGELVGRVARLEGDIRHADGRLAPAGEEFARVIAAFLLWEPETPRTIPQLVRAVANLCRLLRGEVADALRRERAGAERQPVFVGLVDDWRVLLFPELSDEQFADAFAQTITFSLLLARVDGIDFAGKPLSEIARELGKKHSLMGKALNVLTEGTVEGHSIVVTTMLRVIGVVDWDALTDGSRDDYLYLYERFLEHYDRDLRRQSGSFYTPDEVSGFMVRFADEVLRTRLGRAYGLASDDVTIIDPAMGTGTFLLKIVDQVAETVSREEGSEAVPSQLLALFGRLIGFELQTCPFAVAELRMHQALKIRHGTEIPEREVRFFVADALDNPYAEQTQIASTLEPIARSRREANRVKRETAVRVVIGNPPYRERAKGLGGWVEQGDPNSGEDAPLQRFRAPGQGRYEYVLSNLYVYFWRWATWKVFDAHPEDSSGIVAFITPSSFTTGPGYAGMREYLRRTADEGWIIDLSPEGHQAPVNTRVFPGVQHPLCIAVFVRRGTGDPARPAKIRHMSVAGRRTAKFAQLNDVSLADSRWRECGDGWQDRLEPAIDDAWGRHPLLGDLMPWQAPGVKPNRTWVYAPLPETLAARWKRLTAAPPEDKPTLFKESDSRRVDSVVSSAPGFIDHNGSLLAETGPCPGPVRIAYRSFDRQWTVPDIRLFDRPRPDLWRVQGDNQLFVVEQHRHRTGRGPGVVFTALLPDMDHFMGHHGGRVLPLYRDSAGLAANLPPKLCTVLAERLGMRVTAEDVLAYVAAVVAHPGYTERFTKELATPGIRVPMAADAEVWLEAVAIGREVLWLHTYGERFHDHNAGRPLGSPRLPDEERPRVVVRIPGEPAGMPEKIDYDPDRRTLNVGDGRISPVAPRVWEYEVSGMRIVKKWFDYRRREPAGRRSSPLDDINPERWPAKFTTELLELLNVLGRCAALEPAQAQLMDRIVSSPLITTDHLAAEGVLPVSAKERKPVRSTRSDAQTMF
ncbi:type ISP restriction/modification enzyme [Actinomadura rugatobispora]|uniref:site-specific DNA-methyltransferase (adenine-specific) n=1 Tax=Actinomadura rugatobispora TaxID=1994 RepID=A0ABW0ZYH9_9ACTN|nr:hypothetical protein GCM10010200_007650 [Actinomadura rugatobispora]